MRSRVAAPAMRCLMRKKPVSTRALDAKASSNLLNVEWSIAVDMIVPISCGSAYQLSGRGAVMEGAVMEGEV